MSLRDARIAGAAFSSGLKGFRSLGRDARSVCGSTWGLGTPSTIAAQLGNGCLPPWVLIAGGARPAAATSSVSVPARNATSSRRTGRNQRRWPPWAAPWSKNSARRCQHRAAPSSRCSQPAGATGCPPTRLLLIGPSLAPAISPPTPGRSVSRERMNPSLTLKSPLTRACLPSLHPNVAGLHEAVPLPLSSQDLAVKRTLIGTQELVNVPVFREPRVLAHTRPFRVEH